MFNESLLEIPLTPTEALRIGVIMLFGALIFLSFLYGTISGWLLKRRDPKNDFHKEPTRLIGGLSVLVVAIVANNPYIYSIALFIGGLLIASEKFMINLAAIFNSDRKSVHKISEQWKEADGNEVEQKQEEEAEEGTIIEAIQKDQGSKPTTAANKKHEDDFKIAKTSRLDKIKEIESLTLNYLESLVSSPSRALKRYIEDGDTLRRERRIYDAIVINRRSFNVYFSIEILYREALVPNIFRFAVKRVVERMKSDTLPLLIVVVTKGYHDWNSDSLREFKETLKKQYADVNFAFFDEKDGIIDAIDETDLLDLLRQYS